MKLFLKGSLIVGIYSKTLNMLSTIYEASTLKRIVSIIKKWFIHSIIGRFFQNFIGRKSTVKQSVFYRAISKFALALNALVGRVSSFLMAQFASSKTVCTGKEIVKAYSIKPLIIAVYFVLPFAAGYLLISTLKNSLTSGRMAYILLLGIAVITLSALFIKWKSWVKTSMVYRLIHSLWE